MARSSSALVRQRAHLANQRSGRFLTTGKRRAGGRAREQPTLVAPLMLLEGSGRNRWAVVIYLNCQIYGRMASARKESEDRVSVDYQMISVDDHVDLQYLPKDLWSSRLPAH